MNIASFILSVIAVLVTTYNCYRQYFRKKENVLYIPSNAKIENNELKILLLFVNKGDQTATIANTSIQLDTTSLQQYAKLNHSVSINWIQPFTLFPKEQKSIIIDYPLPDLNNINLNDISIRILTYYINEKGKLLQDHLENAGKLLKNNAVYIENVAHQLKGNEIIASAQ